MLPDYPKIKEKLKEQLLLALKMREKKYSGVVADAPQKILMEGHKSSIKREDGEIDENVRKEFKAEVTTPLEGVEDLTVEDLIEKIESIAQEMAKQKSVFLFEEISKTTDKSGNKFDLKGRNFSIDDFFAMLKKIFIEFDKNGKPFLPTMVVGPEIAESINNELQKLEKDPSVRERFSQIISKKKAEWHERENNRKLVG